MASAANTVKYEFKKIEWCEKVEQHLATVPQTDPTISGLEYHKKEVHSGAVALYGVFEDGLHRATALIAVYEGDNGAEYNVLALGGESNHAGLAKYALCGAVKLAKKAKCKVVRFTTCRPGLVHFAQQEGFRVDEIVMRRLINE
jgi:hypothetical protein